MSFFSINNLMAAECNFVLSFQARTPWLSFVLVKAISSKSKIDCAKSFIICWIVSASTMPSVFDGVVLVNDIVVAFNWHWSLFVVSESSVFLKKNKSNWLITNTSRLSRGFLRKISYPCQKNIFRKWRNQSEILTNERCLFQKCINIDEEVNLIIWLQNLQ